MKIDIQLFNLECDSQLKSEHKIQAIKTRALLKNLRNKQEEIKQGNIIIFTHANKRYQKSINSKFNFFNKFAKHNFLKDQLAVYIKIGAFSDVKVRQVKVGSQETKLTYLVLDREAIVFIMTENGVSSSEQQKLKEAMEIICNKEQKKLGCKECELQFGKIIVSSSDSVGQITKEMKQLSKNVQIDRPYKSGNQHDAIYTDMQCEILHNKIIGKIPIEIENPDKIKALKDQFKIDGYKMFAEKSGKMQIYCSLRNGIHVCFGC